MRTRPTRSPTVALAAGLGADEVRKTVESARKAADDARVTSTRSRTGR